MIARQIIWFVMAIVLLVACDDSFENVPRVTPAPESLWALVGIQIDLDRLRVLLARYPGKSFGPERIDRLSAEVVATSEYLTVRPLSDDELRAARYRVDLLSLSKGLIEADALASSGGIGGTTHAGALAGLNWIEDASEHLREDPLWPVKNPAEADRATLMAASHRDNIRRAIPAAALMRDGVTAASVQSGAIGLAQLARAGPAALGRLLGFLDGAEGGPAYVTASLAGGVGSIRVLSGTRALALTSEEVIALANAGALSSTALALYMAASDLHHICTDKNTISDKHGGPWTPRFNEIFKKAGMTLRDQANLVQIKAHRGPHPQAYHEAVMDEIRRATRSQMPGTSGYREALKRALANLAKEIRTPGSRLNRLITQTTSE